MSTAEARPDGAHRLHLGQRVRVTDEAPACGARFSYTCRTGTVVGYSRG